MKKFKKILAGMLAISMVASFASINVAAEDNATGDDGYVAIEGGTWDFEGIIEIPSGVTLTTDNTENKNLVHSETVNNGSLKLKAYVSSGFTSADYGKYWEGATFTAPTPTNAAATVKCEIDTNYAYATNSTKVVVTMSDDKAYTFGWPTWPASWCNNLDYNVDYTVTFNPAEGVLAFDAVGTSSDGTALAGRTTSATKTGVTAASIKNVYIGYTYYNDTRTTLYINDVSFKEESIISDDNKELGRGTVLYDESFDVAEALADAGLTASNSSYVTLENDPLNREGKSLKIASPSTGDVWAVLPLDTTLTSGQYLLEYELYDNFTNTSFVEINVGKLPYKEFNNSYCNLDKYDNGEQLPISKTSWNKIALLYDLDDNKMHVYKNGMYMATKNVTIPDPYQFRFRLYGTNEGGMVYFDNIKLTRLDNFSIIGLNLSSESSKDGNYSIDLNKGSIQSTIAQVYTAIAGDSCTYAVLSAFNAKSTPVQASYIAAAYSNDRLVGTMSGVYGLAAGSSKSQSFCICDILTDEVDTIKLYVWDSLSSMTPMAKSVTIGE